MTRTAALLAFFLGTLALWGQTPFVCDGDFFLSLGPNNSNTGFYRVQPDAVTGQLAFNGFSPGNNSGAVVNGIGYRVTDNFIYGVRGNGNELFRIGADGLANSLGDPGLSNNYNYVAGDVSPDGHYLVVLGHANNRSSILVQIDLTDPSFPTTQRNLTTTGGGNVFTADMTFDPLTGTVYGYDANADRLITIDLATGVLNNTLYPANQQANLLGAMYFDAFGELHGYGSPLGGGGQNTFFDIDLNTGALTPVATGPLASQNDGCSCAFTIEMDHWASPAQAKPCDTVAYFVVVANNSGGDKDSLDLVAQLPPGLVIDQIVANPFPGTLTSGPGTNLLRIEDVTVPVGIDTLKLSVIVQSLPLSSPLLRSQGRLLGLPAALGDSVLSDNPFTGPSPDSAVLTLSVDTVILPTQTLGYCAGDSLALDASNLPANEWRWSNGDTGPTTVIDQPGTYFVYALECSVSIDTFVVEEWALPQIDASPDTAICRGQPLSLQVSGTQSYAWYRVAGNSYQGAGDQFSPTTNTSADYYVIGTDANGCEDRDTVAVTVRPLPNVSGGPDTALCYYEQVQLGFGGNDPSWQFAWTPANLLGNGSLMQPQFVHDVPGTYNLSLQATDTFGCQNSDPVTVTVHDFQLALITEDVDCFGHANGSATVSVTAGQPTFSYWWTDDQGLLLASGTQTASSVSQANLVPGTYQALVTDANGCRDSVGFAISQPAAPLSSEVLALQNVDCFGNANGSIEIGGLGGTPPYEYSIDGGFNYQAFGLFAGLGGSNYTLQTRDANGCLTQLTDTIKSPTGLFGDILTKKNLDCFGAQNGGLRLAGAGGTAPYSLNLNGTLFAGTLTLSNLGAGADTVLLLDDNGCQVPILFNILEPAPLLADSVFQRDLACFGQPTGALAITAQGGTGAYQYSLDGLVFQPDSFFQPLAAGPYAVLVQDDSLCRDTVDFLLTEPPLLTLENIVQKNVGCYGHATGAITVTGQGGTAPYQYQFDTLAFQPQTRYENLSAGDYLVVVEDDSACQASLLVTISEPDSLALRITAQAEVACFGDRTGFVRLQALGGTPAYAFSADSLSFAPDSLLTGLAAGVQRFWVQDDSSCVAWVETEITQPLALVFDTVEVEQVDCFGNANGQAVATVSGGIAPYRYRLDSLAWQGDAQFAPLAPGTYQLQVQDDSACVTAFELTITEPPLLILAATATDVSCYGFGDGQGIAAALGGTPGFSYAWDTEPVQTTSEATGLDGGTYGVQVWDEKGCEARDTLTVFEPDSLTLELLPGSVVEAYCDWPNGQAEVDSEGGILPHTYRWEGANGSAGRAVDDLLGGDYVVTVTDANGCETPIEVFIPFTPPASPAFATLPSHEDSILLSQARIRFENLSQGAVAYTWDFGDGGIASDEQPVWTYEETGAFRVTLTAFNAYFDCPVDTSLWLTIIPDGALFIPNAFSPNGDGYNDRFLLGGEGLVRYELQVFNRWGERLAVIQNLAEGWDGTNAQGQPVPEGVYVYRVTAEMNNGARLERGGTITLIR